MSSGSFRRGILVLLMFTWVFTVHAQNFNAYLPTFTIKEYRASLKDTLNLEVIIPREKEMAPGIRRPVLYLFDRQNEINYNYQLQTIDYLTSIGAMPASVIVSVSFPPGKRTAWTLPNREKGMADSLLDYLFTLLPAKIGRICPLAGFKVLIGHSRTAILSQYALAAYPDKVQAVIGASNSFFDFNSAFQKNLFDQYCNNLESAGTPRFFFFSSGTNEQGDAHESSVDRLVSYLDSARLPQRLHWRHYKEPASHMTTPGLTVSRALNELFSPGNKALHACFDLLNAPVQTDSIPWAGFLEKWKEAEMKVGCEFPPTLVFFNSIASGYLNDYNNQYNDKKFKLAQDILRKAITYFPDYPGFYSFYASICLETGDKPGAILWSKKATLVLNKLKETTSEFRQEERMAIKEVEEGIKNYK